MLACMIRVTNRVSVRVSLGFRNRVRVKVRVTTFMYSVWPTVSVRVRGGVRV